MLHPGYIFTNPYLSRRYLFQWHTQTAKRRNVRSLKFREALNSKDEALLDDYFGQDSKMTNPGTRGMETDDIPRHPG
jgi:hypothetical protein